MTVIEDCVSSCCGAKIEARGGSPDFIGDDRQGITMCHHCVKCGQPCGFQSPNEETLKTMKETDEGKGLIKFNNVDELFEENWR